MPSTFTDYNVGATNSGGPSMLGAAGQAEQDDYWDLGKLKQAFLDYVGNKSEEIEEQKEARRYYHASQWTAEQIKKLKKRNQPVLTFNRIGRKIDGVVGLIERLRQDPKAYPRTPQHEEGAELATAVLRYVLDEQRWKEKSPECARDGAIDGVGGIELVIEQGDQGDPEVGFEIVEPDSFIYDPRSYRADFSDAMYMGVAKWMDYDTLKRMFPDAEIPESLDSVELSTNPDRERRWFTGDRTVKKARVVDLWYQHNGGWCWCLFTGSTKLMEGQSFLKDEKGKDFCKYLMFSGNVDQDGDRYGFVRNMKSAQDAINARESKMQHILASRRLIIQQGAVTDVEVTRREWSRPDGVVQTVGPVNEGVKSDDQSFDFAGWTKMREAALAEIENFGPNPALIGQGIENKSGRAIALLQQAGIAELGPYILAYKGWKLRVYRAIYNAVRAHWKAQRWIRVTDDEGIAQFIGVNQLGVNPDTGMPAIINELGALDVDIIIDEAADQVNLQADAYETLETLARGGAQVPPQVLIELSPLQSSVKKKVLGMIQQAQAPNPVAQELAAKKAFAEIADTEASADQKRSAAFLNIAKAGATTAEALAPPEPNTGAAPPVTRAPVGPAAPTMPGPAGPPPMPMGMPGQSMPMHPMIGG